MRTRTRVVSPDAPDPDAIAEAAEIIRRGGLVAFATETVYGLGADATRDASVRRIFEAKGRESSNPLIVHVDSVESARPIAAVWPPIAEALADRFWPGPLTLVLPKTLRISGLATAGGPTVGLRVPRPTVARDLIARAGVPIAAPSANRSLGISPTLARHVAKDLDGRIEMILDSGPTAVGIESTVLDLTADPPMILRPGSITPDDLSAILGVRPEIGARSGVARSPGLASIHYAPRTIAYRGTLDDLIHPALPENTGLLLIGQASPRLGRSFAHRVELLTPDFAEPAFYDALHRLDELNLDAILVIPPPDLPAWRALLDRIGRATRPLPRSDQG
jgi:L-threonylcarbamoyladenylate synthase